MSATNAGRKKSKKTGEEKAPGRLVLCFDGTGNKFTGIGDTNIVKLYQMCDRESKGQYHYYQPGIGTYSASESSINAGIFGSISRWFGQAIDQGIGTTFDHHVIAGYKFLMRYYKPGDLVFIFGFSRGAFTARFLARLVTEIGLLSKGNEEMVPFAYRTYQDYETGGGRFKTADESKAFMKSFKETFCRQDVNIHFLGLFDTVNSVGTFELPFRKKTYLPVHAPAADHIRHAVAMDERRLKFKPALFDHDGNQHDGTKKGVIKEVWFPGNHGDIGGGWDPVKENGVEVRGGVQLSDLVLEWMIKELDELPGPADEKLVFEPERKRKFLEKVAEHRSEVINHSLIHDALGIGKGWSWIQVGFWWIFEILPIFKRLELDSGEWKSQYFPAGMGRPRDLPKKAVLDTSVLQRIDAEGHNYKPNNLFIDEAKKHTLALLNRTN